VTDVTLLSTYLSQEQVPSLQNNKNSFNRGAGKRSLISLAVAMALATGASQINAAGLGRLSVQSALGQPLRAEVEVTALGKDEVGNIVAKLASQDAFKQAGLEYSPALSNLRFTVDKRADGRHFVRITSAVPINEPFVDLMVELTWPTGRFVREYTFLLDPAELKVGGQSVAGGETRTETVVPPAPLASVTPSAPVAAAVPSGVATAPSTLPAAPVAKAVATPKATAPAAASTTGSSGNYDVKRGDTLARIAARNKPSSVSLEQAIVAIYRANPSAFLGNVNRLKANVSLNIPEEGAMAAVSIAEARQEVRVRSTGFSSYKTRVARAAKAAPSVAKAGQSASGAISGQVVDAGQKPAAQDQVKLSKGAGKGAGSASALGASGKEAKIASGAALSEANSRVTALEKNVSDLQKLLAAKDKQLADAQDRLKTAGTAGKSVDGVIGKAPATAAKVDVAKVDAPKVDLPKPDAKTAKIEVPKLDVPKIDTPKVEAPKVVAKVDTPKLEVPKIDAPAAVAKPATPPVVVPPAVPSGVATDPLSKFDTPKSDAGKVEPPKVDATIPKVEAPKVETPKVETPKVETPKSVAPVPVPVADKGILDTIQDDYPFALPGLGGLALVGGAYGLYAMRRRKKAEKFEDSLMEGEAFSANSLFGTTGGQNVDTSVATNATSTKTESGVEVGSTEVDPIAEAEVYIAYGREGQAEEILKEALRKQGDRQAIRMKLLEIYAGRKDTAAFESVAREMHAQTRGKNEEWPKVVTLGMSIDPSNSLYTGNDSGSGLSGSALGGIAAAGALGVGAIGAGFSALGGKAEAAVGGLSQAGKNAGSSAIDSLQAASQIVPPIPDFMAEQKFGDTKPLDTKTESLDFDFTPKTTISKAAERLTGNSQMPDVGNSFGELDLPSLDLPAKAGASIATAKKVAADDLDFSIDLPSLEALTGNGAASSNAFDMDFNSTATAVASTTTQSAAWQEMATKLDLAAAYEEIGDKDGARELLDEVVKGGDSSQQQKAKAMLSKLS
jgi:pilus assembly protein FimV